MKTLFFIIIAFANLAQADTGAPINNVFDCISYLQSNAVNTVRNKKMDLSAIKYLCKSSAHSVEALRDVAYCTFNLYSLRWKLRDGRGVSATAYGAVYACAYSDGKRNDCAVAGIEAGSYPEEISSLCNPHKEYVIDETNKLF